MKKLILLALLFIGCESNPMRPRPEDGAVGQYVYVEQCAWWEFWCEEDRKVPSEPVIPCPDGSDDCEPPF